MRIELSRLHQELKTTMIYVTHDQVEAMTLGQRIVVFNAGRVEHPSSTARPTTDGQPYLAARTRTRTRT